MHLAHCQKASITSLEWPFLPPNSRIWILLENPSFFFLSPLEEVDLLESLVLLSLLPLWLPLLPLLLCLFLREVSLAVLPSVVRSSSLEVWRCGYHEGEGSLFKGEPIVLQGGEKLDAVPSLSHSLIPPAVPASLGVGRAACSWKGMAFAQRLVNWCIETRHS